MYWIWHTGTLKQKATIVSFVKENIGTGVFVLYYKYFILILNNTL